MGNDLASRVWKGDVSESSERERRLQLGERRFLFVQRLRFCGKSRAATTSQARNTQQAGDALTILHIPIIPLRRGVSSPMRLVGISGSERARAL